MNQPPLDADEYILEAGIARYGNTQNAIFKCLMIFFIAAIGYYLFFYLPKLYGIYASTPTLANDPAIQSYVYAYIPILVLLGVVASYFILSFFKEKLVLTNKAIIRQNLFSTERILLSDVLIVDARRVKYRRWQKSATTGILLGAITGMDWLVDIRANENQQMMIRYMTKHFAMELKTLMDTTLGVQ